MEVIVWFLLRAATMTDDIATSVVSFDTLPLEALTGCITFVHIFWICCVGGGRDIAFQPLRAISFDDDYSDGSRYQDTQDRRFIRDYRILVQPSFSIGTIKLLLRLHLPAD